MNATDQLPSVSTSNNLSPDLTEARKHLIVALDFPTEAEALALVDRLGTLCQWFKVGLELYLSAGNSIVSEIDGARLLRIPRSQAPRHSQHRCRSRSLGHIARAPPYLPSTPRVVRSC